MKIESVKVKNTNNNYQKIIYALVYLDMCITGGEVKDIKVSQHDILVIKNLFSNILNETTTVTFDKYILDTFDAFIQHKKRVYLAFNRLEHANSDIRDLLMNKMEKGIDKTRKEDDFTNLFHSQLLSIFKNVKVMRIWTSTEYCLSMIGLLSLIQSSSLDKITVVSSGKDNWIKKLWNAEKETLEKQYETRMHRIKKKKEDNSSFVINKKL